MEDDILKTIESLTNRARAKQDDLDKLKNLINELCAEAGIASRFENVSEAGNLASLRSDQFYGMPLTSAIRGYLELRKSSGLGAATVTEIFRSIKGGGYKFDTKNDDNARIGVANALRKSSSIFHRLPNGQYGLLSWYPSAKVPAGDIESETPKRRSGKKTKKAAATKKAQTQRGSTDVTNREIRDVILAQPGNFQSTDIEKILTTSLPTKAIPHAKVSAVIFLLKKKGLLKMVKERSGKTGADFL